jgi:penicillin-binding protein-related factor A (putative recombinase)
MAEIRVSKDRLTFRSTEKEAILAELKQHGISCFITKTRTSNGKIYAVQINDFSDGELKWFAHADATRKSIMLPKYSYPEKAKHTRKGYIPGNKAHLIKRPTPKKSDEGYSFITERLRKC